MVGQKRKREQIEEQIYSKLNIPYYSDSPINFFLSQIIKEYDEGMLYNFSFEGLAENIIVSCIWGYMPICDKAIANFTKRVQMDDIASYVNFGKIDRVFNFFAGITCLINVDNDILKQLSFFENGKYGYIYEGKKDYYLLININSLDKFEFIDKNNDYCQFWLIKIDDYKILQLLGLKPKNEQIEDLLNRVEDFKNIIKEKDAYFQKERQEYIDRIKKITNEKDKELQMIEEKYEKYLKEKEELIEQFKIENKNRLKRVRKFLGLKIHKECFSLIEENNVYSYEELANESHHEEESSISQKNNEEFTCIICYIRKRNILFEKCNHCCICDICLEKCLRKFNKKKKSNEYFCPICNNNTKQDENNTNYTSIRKIYFS